MSDADQPSPPDATDRDPAAEGAADASPRAASADAAAAPDLLASLGALLARIPAAIQSDPSARQHLEAIRSSVGQLLDATSAAGDDAERKLADAAGAVKAAFAHAGAEAATRAEAHRADLTRSLQESGLLDPKRLGQTLRNLGDWLEQRTAEAGEHIDALAASLEQSVGRVIRPDQESDQERDQRVRETARSAIAARLRERGLAPMDDPSDDPSDT